MTGRAFLKVMSGSQKGQKIPLPQKKITLGRADENTISVKSDARMSRQHASIEWNQDSFIITNTSVNNNVLINQVAVKAHRLQNQDQIKIGDTEFVFEMKEKKENQDGKLAQQGQVVPTSYDPLLASTPSSAWQDGIIQNQNYEGNEEYEFGVEASSRPLGGGAPIRRGPPKMDPGKIRFYSILGGVIVLFGVLVLLKNNEKRSLIEIRSSDVVHEEMSQSQQRQLAYNKKIEEQGQSSPQFQEAQTFFVKGFRDYRQGRFERAIESFSAALAIDGSHTNAQRYYQLALRKFDEQVQFHMIQGHRYLEKSNYKMCKAEFEKVLVMVKKSNDPKYIEAVQFYRECEMMGKGRY